MLDNLGDRLQSAVHKIKGYGKITEDNINEITKELRLALLEADVNYKVVKEFIAKVKEKALGEEVRKSLKPSEVFIKIVKEELILLLGSESSALNLDNFPILMLVGLQGSGKTTTIAKIANHLKTKEKRNPLLVACDIYRPQAVEQLKQLGEQLGVFVYSEDNKNPLEIAKNAVLYARENHHNYVLIDTAGRLHIDEELMEELKSINEVLNPQEILLVIDSMTGQDAINVIEGFNNQLSLTGTILTKMDGDTKGGVALSIKHLTNLPIKFVGVSEKLDGLREFHPERVASRILGMGDFLSMAEKVESVIDEEDAKSMTKKMMSGDFNLEDFLEQIKQMKKLGPLENILKMLPGASKIGLNNVTVDPKDIMHTEAIILSMTPYERKNPHILKASRKKRIAKGSGTSVQEVNLLLKKFEQMKFMMKQLKGGKIKFPF